MPAVKRAHSWNVAMMTDRHERLRKVFQILGWREIFAPQLVKVDQAVNPSGREPLEVARPLEAGSFRVGTTAFGEADIGRCQPDAVFATLLSIIRPK